MDANFMGDVADIYKCIVCHLALKEPVLFVECGHRLCKLCFENLCKYATEHNNPVLCPHDRKEIDPEKVVDDKGVGRTILDLQVYCDNKSEGCNWSGELRHLENHVRKQCKVTTMKKFMEEIRLRLDGKDREVRELQQRLSLKDEEIQKLKEGSDVMEQRFKCVESYLHANDEEIALLKYELSSLRSNVLRVGGSKDYGPSAETGRKKRKMRDEISEGMKENVTDFGNADGWIGSSATSSERKDVDKSIKVELLGLNKEPPSHTQNSGPGNPNPDPNPNNYFPLEMLHQFRAQIMAYKLFSRNQPVPESIALVAMGCRKTQPPANFPGLRGLFGPPGLWGPGQSGPPGLSAGPPTLSAQNSSASSEAGGRTAQGPGPNCASAGNSQQQSGAPSDLAPAIEEGKENQLPQSNADPSKVSSPVVPVGAEPSVANGSANTKDLPSMPQLPATAQLPKKLPSLNSPPKSPKSR